MYKSKTNEKTKLIRDRLMRFYVIEEAEIARMAAQLADDIDTEDEIELAEHFKRRDILFRMLKATTHTPQEIK